MTGLLVKLFIKNSEDIHNVTVRSAYGVLTSVVGIICNVLLCVVKMIIGLFVGSVAVVADSLNNLSDAASSIIGLIGVKLSEKPADKEHPFGHGRYEYIAALVVAFIILQVGFTCFKSSFSKIFNPEEMDASILTTAILGDSMAVKLWLSFFNRKLGKKVDSKVMLATAKDALGDVAVTGATVVSLVVLQLTGLNIDGYVGTAVSVMVVIAGFGIAKDTIEPLLGEATSEELYHEISKKVESYEGVVGTHDLIVHSYGPMRRMATIHAEVRKDIDIEVAHETIDKIERDIHNEMNIMIVIHMDPVDISENVIKHKSLIADIVKEIEPCATIHDFRLVNGINRINLIFDLVLPYTYKKEDERRVIECITRRAKECDERFECVITVENSFVRREEL